MYLLYIIIFMYLNVHAERKDAVDCVASMPNGHRRVERMLFESLKMFRIKNDDKTRPLADLILRGAFLRNFVLFCSVYDNTRY